MPPHDIEGYVNELTRALHRDFRDEPALIQRIADETRDHLLEERERRIDAGFAPDDAERTAIEQFGCVRSVSKRFSRELGVTLTPVGALGSFALYFASLIGVLIAAFGVSLIGVTALAYATGSMNPMGPATTVTYSGRECSGLVTMPAEAMDIGSRQECAEVQAALGSTTSMVFMQILLIGGTIAAVAGGIALATSHQLLRWLHHGRTDRSLLGNSYRVVGAALFALLTLGVTTTTLDSGSSQGPSIYFLWPAALVTLGICAAYGRSLRRALA